METPAAGGAAPGGAPLDFFGYSRERLGSELTARHGERAYRATQLYRWVYKRGVTDVSSMTDLARDFRETAGREILFPEAAVAERQVSRDGTRKYLLEMERGDRVEAVMIKQPSRMTLCVSSQVGCGMGCAFCRTATMGFKRHLSASEIIRQVVAVRRDSKENFGDDFSNIVFMGMGEPLHNVKNVVEAVKILTDPHGLFMAPRRVTVSTSGLVPAIAEFGASVSANLAVSLNATTDEVRTAVMPVNKAYPLADLLGCLRRYPVKNRQKITIEYVLLAGVNDSPADLRRLPGLLRGIPAKVNLIPYNENAGLGFGAPSRETVDRWVATLAAKDIDVTVRWSKGQDIDAACGQLASATGKRPPLPPTSLAVLPTPAPDLL